MTMVEEFCVYCYGTLFGSDDEYVEELLRCSECLKYGKFVCSFHPELVFCCWHGYSWIFSLAGNNTMHCYHTKVFTVT